MVDPCPSTGVAELPDVEIAEDDPFELIFTSGTTGRPKAAVLSHRSIVSYLMLQGYSGGARRVPRGRDGPTAGRRRRVSRTFPLFHVSGLSTAVGMHDDAARRACGRSDASTPRR